MDYTPIDCRIADIVQKTIDITGKSRRDDRELTKLHKHAHDIMKVHPAKHVEVCLVGQQATGKSLAINALLHRRRLSKISASGSACTATAIKYIHHPERADDSDLYDIDIQFMDDECLLEATEEHIRRYYHFNYSDNVDPDFSDEEEAFAESAMEFFNLVCDIAKKQENQVELDLLLCQPQIENGRLLQHILDKARLRILATGANSAGVKKLRNITTDQFNKSISDIVTHSDTKSPMWPIVQHVNIYMGSALLKNGVTLVACPGLGDLNHNRTAVTNALRRQAHAELIFGKSARVETDQAIHRQIKDSIKAHGAQNTILVLTKIDEFLLEDHAIETIISENESHPFPDIARHHKLANAQIDEIVRKQEEDNQDIAEDELDSQLDSLKKYQDYLTHTAKITYIRNPANNLERTMRCKLIDGSEPNPITVVSITASIYLQWMQTRLRQPPVLSPHITGIPYLRKILTKLPMDAEWRQYRDHVTKRIPLFLDKVTWAIDTEHRNVSYEKLRPMYKRFVQSFEEKQKDSLKHFLQTRTPSMWPHKRQANQQLEAIDQVVQEWSNGVRWNTFDRMLRERGTPFKSQAAKYRGQAIHWNDDICRAIAPEVARWSKELKSAIALFTQDVRMETSSLCQQVSTFIQRSSLPVVYKNIAQDEWKKCQTTVLNDTLQLLRDLLDEQVERVHRYASTETDIRCMIAKLNIPVYDYTSNLPKAPGRFKRQQKELRNEIVNQDGKGEAILDRITEALRSHTWKELDSAFNVFVEELHAQLILFDDHIYERLPPQYMITPKDQELRMHLEKALRVQKTKANALLALFCEKYSQSRMAQATSLISGEGSDGEAINQESPRKLRKVTLTS
ncbi:hypothetical protein BU24DRAFT_404580 [Aaosphaeria arxii CBS 175.79]|uniref:P-loop containing nucleoside triphosphate hydrolase protein n=1 Tax=Aaosphaeria arxii CBS 175.79 TaxID=1450172 RepID=A0A6A5Y7M8_9PLEO|nr:uncharacterized protein BU24DRAFT_404580 [Aaosphaeria arxii CBS 175.79]KAF2021575.1 hypothetical protein BU24DRAFT_404580 [Aaosphaeria arxii CBS 175.79]